MSSVNPAPVETQPQNQFPGPPIAVVPPGLEVLVKEEEVVLKDKVFQTKTGQTLFSVCRESECCGPSLNLRLRNPHRRDVVSLCLDSGGGCCGGETHLRVSAPPTNPIGFVIIVSSSTSLSASIQMGNREPVLCAKMPVNMDADISTIQILSIDGSHPVASITKEKVEKSSQVVFRFPMDMAATLKATILAAFLYMSYSIKQESSSSRDGDDDVDVGWATAGGVDLIHMQHHHHYHDDSSQSTHHHHHHHVDNDNQSSHHHHHHHHHDYGGQSSHHHHHHHDYGGQSSHHHHHHDYSDQSSHHHVADSGGHHDF